MDAAIFRSAQEPIRKFYKNDTRKPVARARGFVPATCSWKH